MQHDGGKGDSLEQGKPGFRDPSRGGAAPGEHRVVKTHCSSSVNNGLDAKLKQLGVTGSVIAGLQTDFCIDTARRVAQPGL